MRRRALAWVALLALAALAPLHVRAQAEVPSWPAEVLVIHGSTDGNSTDPALEKLEALRKPPFDAFTKKVLLQRLELRLSEGGSSEVDLPNGRKLRLSLLQKLKDGRFRLSLSINRPGQRDYLPVMTVVAAPGDPFFVAGQKHDGGTLIIGVRVGAVRT